MNEFKPKSIRLSECVAEIGIRNLLKVIGADPDREGLQATPERVVKAFREMTRGENKDPTAILERTFEDGSSTEMIVLRGIRFVSLCEHHLMPFSGTATVAYIPNGNRVVGISKLARLVQCFACRLQLQERLTRQVATTLHDTLKAKGAACILTAKHSCMGCRGVKQPDAELVTSHLTGVLLTDPSAKAELLQLKGQ